MLSHSARGVIHLLIELGLGGVRMRVSAVALALTCPSWSALTLVMYLRVIMFHICLCVKGFSSISTLVISIITIFHMILWSVSKPLGAISPSELMPRYMSSVLMLLCIQVAFASRLNTFQTSHSPGHRARCS